MYLIFILNKLVYKYGLDLSKYLIYIYKVLSKFRKFKKCDCELNKKL